MCSGIEWEKLENELTKLRESYQKINQELTNYQARLESQEELTQTAREEVALVRKELSASWANSEILNAKNAMVVAT